MKSLIKNQVGSKMFSFAVPASAAMAKDFCDQFLVGTYAIFEKTSSGGSDAPVTAFKNACIVCKNSETNETVYFFIAIPVSRGANEISATLIGKTFNGVKVDKVFIKYNVSVAVQQSFIDGIGSEHSEPVAPSLAEIFANHDYESPDINVAPSADVSPVVEPAGDFTNEEELNAAIAAEEAQSGSKRSK